MARRPGANELIVGVATDRSSARSLLFGQGGIAVEVTADHAVGAAAAEHAAGAGDGVPHPGLPPAARLPQPAGPAASMRSPVRWCGCRTWSADIAEIAELDINPLLADSAA